MVVVLVFVVVLVVIFGGGWWWLCFLWVFFYEFVVNGVFKYLGGDFTCV